MKIFHQPNDLKWCNTVLCTALCIQWHHKTITNTLYQCHNWC